MFYSLINNHELVSLHVLCYYTSKRFVLFDNGDDLQVFDKHKKNQNIEVYQMLLLIIALFGIEGGVHEYFE